MKTPEQIVAGLLDALEKAPRSRKELQALTGMTWQDTSDLMDGLREEFGVKIDFDNQIGRYELVSRGKL